MCSSGESLALVHIFVIIALKIGFVPLAASFTENQLNYPNLVESQQLVKKYLLYGHDSQEFAAFKTNVFSSKVTVFVAKTQKSIFSPNFQFRIISENGTKIVDATPTSEELTTIEKRHYINPDQDAALSLNITVEGIKIIGVIQNLSFISMERKDSQSSKTVANKVDNTCTVPTSDFIDSDQNTPLKNVTENVENGNKTETKKTFAQVHVFVMVDSEIFNNMYRGNKLEIIDYISVLMHAVNNRFGYYIDPRLRFTISGVFAISSEAQLYIIENNKLPGGTLDLKKTLIDFSKWLFENNNTIPKHDMALLLLGKSKTHNKENVCHVQGFFRGAGRSNSTEKMSYSAVVVEDDGFYGGFRTVVHEFAHNLGAEHDGVGNSLNCSKEDGYAMSFEGFDYPQHNYFSVCSLKSMKNYIDSCEGTCLKITQRESNPFIKIHPENGEKTELLNMTRICQKRLKSNDATVAPFGVKFASFLCRSLVCLIKVEALGGTTKKINLYSPVPENTPCGHNGICQNNQCADVTTA